MSFDSAARVAATAAASAEALGAGASFARWEG